MFKVNNKDARWEREWGVGWVGAGAGAGAGRGVVHSKVILVPQKMLNKTWILKMAVCKAASREFNQNP